ncbi:hypothetical protein BC831DRAFT_399473 [Entophlyctis helioformis]|nr:hypothetical protein BC831DRAFT_399473 [Entophlyctis helioformis]
MGRNDADDDAEVLAQLEAAFAASVAEADAEQQARHGSSGSSSSSSSSSSGRSSFGAGGALAVTAGGIALLAGLTGPFVVSALRNRIPWVPTTNEKTGVVFANLARVWRETGGPWRGQPGYTVPAIAPTTTTATTTTAVPPALKFVDMGSGDGRMVFAASQYGRSATAQGAPFMFGCAVGVERNFTLWAWSNVVARCWHWLPPRRARILKQDFWQTDLRDADVVMVFGVPAWMTQFGAKFEQELRPGSLVATNKFPIPGWHPLVTDTEISIYRMGMHLQDHSHRLAQDSPPQDSHDAAAHPHQQ